MTGANIAGSADVGALCVFLDNPRLIRQDVDRIPLPPDETSRPPVRSRGSRPCSSRSPMPLGCRSVPRAWRRRFAALERAVPTKAEPPRRRSRSLVVYPAQITLDGPRDEQRLGVLGEYADGRTWDLSRDAEHHQQRSQGRRGRSGRRPAGRRRPDDHHRRGRRAEGDRAGQGRRRRPPTCRSASRARSCRS